MCRCKQCMTRNTHERNRVILLKNCKCLNTSTPKSVVVAIVVKMTTIVLNKSVKVFNHVDYEMLKSQAYVIF